MLNVCKQLFDLWNSEVEYCHWKSNEHLMDGLNGLTDLDVYVSPKDKDKAEELLIKTDYIKFKPQKGARYPMVDEWIGFDCDTGKLVHIHLHYRIITGTKYNKEYIFPLDSVVIENRVLDEETNVFVISPEIETIILYSRIVLKSNNKSNIILNKDYVKEIEYLKHRLSQERLREYCQEFIGDDGVVIYNYIAKEHLDNNEWYELYKLIYKWLKPYCTRNSLVVKLRYQYYYLRAVCNAILNNRFSKHVPTRKTFDRTGISVCFLGADGSGKSTVSLDVQKWLNWKLEASRFYLGSGDHYNGLTKKILNKVSSKYIKKAPATKQDAPTQRRGNAPAKRESLKLRVLKWGYSLLQCHYLKTISVRSYKEIKKARKYTAVGAIAVFDRFPQLQFEGLYDGPKISVRFFEKYKNVLFRWMSVVEVGAIRKAQCMQPDVVIKLHLPAEESIRRKPDHTLEEVKPKAEITAKLKFDSSSVYDVDATQDYEDELLEIKRIIWKEMLKR